MPASDFYYEGVCDNTAVYDVIVSFTELQSGLRHVLCTHDVGLIQLISVFKNIISVAVQLVDQLRHFLITDLIEFQ